MATAEPSASVVNPPTGWPRILPHVIYDDVGGAIDWLGRAFGFRERAAARHTGPDGTIGRTQMTVEDSLITLGAPSVHGVAPRQGASTMLYVYVDDVERHYQRSRAAGAQIVLPLEDRPWGDRCYQATDPEGHQWTFAEHVVDVELGPCDDEHRGDEHRE